MPKLLSVVARSCLNAFGFSLANSSRIASAHRWYVFAFSYSFRSLWLIPKLFSMAARSCLNALGFSLANSSSISSARM